MLKVVLHEAANDNDGRGHQGIDLQLKLIWQKFGSLASAWMPSIKQDEVLALGIQVGKTGKTFLFVGHGSWTYFVCSTDY